MISGVLLFVLIAQSSASFYDDFTGALGSVKSNVGKLLSDVGSDLRDTYDCTVDAVEEVIYDPDQISEYYNKCKQTSTTTTESNKVTVIKEVPQIISIYVKPIELEHPKNYVTTKSDDTISRDRKDIDHKIASVENIVNNEYYRLDNMTSHLELEFYGLSKNIDEKLKMFEMEKEYLEKTLLELKNLHLEEEMEIERDKEEIRRFFDEMLKKINSSSKASDLKDEINSAIIDIEKHSSKTILEQIEKWKDKGMAKLKNLQELEKIPNSVNITDIPRNFKELAVKISRETTTNSPNKEFSKNKSTASSTGTTTLDYPTNIVSPLKFVSETPRPSSGESVSQTTMIVTTMTNVRQKQALVSATSTSPELKSTEVAAYSTTLNPNSEEIKSIPAKLTSLSATTASDGSTSTQAAGYSTTIATTLFSNSTVVRSTLAEPISVSATTPSESTLNPNSEEIRSIPAKLTSLSATTASDGSTSTQASGYSTTIATTLIPNSTVVRSTVAEPAESTSTLRSISKKQASLPFTASFAESTSTQASDYYTAIATALTPNSTLIISSQPAPIETSTLPTNTSPGIKPTVAVTMSTSVQPMSDETTKLTINTSAEPTSTHASISTASYSTVLMSTEPSTTIISILKEGSKATMSPDFTSTLPLVATTATSAELSSKEDAKSTKTIAEATSSPGPVLSGIDSLLSPIIEASTLMSNDFITTSEKSLTSTSTVLATQSYQPISIEVATFSPSSPAELLTTYSTINEDMSAEPVFTNSATRTTTTSAKPLEMITTTIVESTTTPTTEMHSIVITSPSEYPQSQDTPTSRYTTARPVTTTSTEPVEDTKLIISSTEPMNIKSSTSAIEQISVTTSIAPPFIQTWTEPPTTVTTSPIRQHTNWYKPRHHPRPRRKKVRRRKTTTSTTTTIRPLNFNHDPPKPKNAYSALAQALNIFSRSRKTKAAMEHFFNHLDTVPTSKVF